MRRFLWLFFAALLLAGVVVASSGGATQAEARWVVTDLGTLGGKNSEAVAINDRGQIAGSSTDQSLTLENAFLWENGKMRKLETLRGLHHSQAADINSRAQIIGSSFNWDHDDDRLAMSRAILWENGQIRTLSTPKKHASEASAINDVGEIVGWDDETNESGLPNLSRHAVLWLNGQMRDIGTLEGDGNSEGAGINERTQVVGVSGELDPNSVMFNSRGFVWQDGTMRSLGRLGQGGECFAINDKGQIVGSRREHATVWESGKPHDLATTSREYSWAASINNLEQIVGSWLRNLYADPRAAHWESGKRTLLPNLAGGSASGASDINDKGQVVGWAEAKNGKSHAVLWTLKR